MFLNISNHYVLIYYLTFQQHNKTILKTYMSIHFVVVFFSYISRERTFWLTPNFQVWCMVSENDYILYQIAYQLRGKLIEGEKWLLHNNWWTMLQIITQNLFRRMFHKLIQFLLNILRIKTNVGLKFWTM